MKYAFALLVPLLACFPTLSPAQTEPRIGYLNLERVLRDSPLAVKAQKKLEGEFAKRDQELGKLADQMKRLQENLEKNSVTMSEADRRNKEREFGDLNREFQRKQREFKEDLNLRQNEEMAAIFDRVNKVIKNIAETEKFDLILQEAVYAGQRIDLTERVIKILGEGNK